MVNENYCSKANLTIDINKYDKSDKGLSNKMLYISIFYHMGSLIFKVLK